MLRLFSLVFLERYDDIIIFFGLLLLFHSIGVCVVVDVVVVVAYLGSSIFFEFYRKVLSFIITSKYFVESTL
jgi:hypothetical protein